MIIHPAFIIIGIISSCTAVGTIMFTVGKNGSKSEEIEALRKDLEEEIEKKRAKDMCNQLHKETNEKLKCIPEIKATVVRIDTTLNILVKKNGK